MNVPPCVPPRPNKSKGDNLCIISLDSEYLYISLILAWYILNL